MNVWLVAISSAVEAEPDEYDVRDVRVVVVQSETAPGVRAAIEEKRPGQKIRWVRPEW